MIRVRTLLTLSATEWRLLCSALPLVAVIRLALWLLPSRVIVRAVRARAGDRGEADAVRPPAPPADARATAQVDAATVTWAVEAASRCVPGATCLTQALAAQLLLRRNGYDARLCLGVARDGDGRFRAHAWLERRGRVLIGAGGMRELTRMPDLAPAAGAPAHGERTR